MNEIFIFLIIAALLLAIIEHKFNPRIDKVETEDEISFLLYYTIKSKCGTMKIRDYIILFKTNK